MKHALEENNMSVSEASILKSATALLLGLAVVTGGVMTPFPGHDMAAFAQDTGDTGDGDDGDGDGEGGNGAGNQGGAGQGQGQGNQGGAGAGQGQGAQGGAGGTMPPWASEGIPEVELGRLSVARSPSHVIDRAYDEALLTLASMAEFYNMTLDQMIEELSLNWDNITIIDSPLQNLAIFRDALDGSIDLSSYGITNDAFTMMAVTLGIASDKTVPITAETAYAVSVIFEMPLSEAEATALAEAAEAIRIAVLAGHG
jgi:hypothetical protein